MIKESFMTTELDAGLEVHLGNLHLAINTLSDHVKELRENLRNMQDDLDLDGQVVYNSTAGVVNFIDLGHPSAGKRWQVRGIQIAGADITQTPAGTAWIMVQSLAPSNNPSIAMVQDWTKGALPQNAFYGRGEFIVHQMEHLYVLILGGTNGQQYTASANVESFPEWRAMRP